MNNQTLTFHLPCNPKPSKASPSSQIVAIDGWSLIVKKTGSTRTRSGRTITVSSRHYDSFCDAFQGTQGSKNVTITFIGSTVYSIDWGTGTISLPDTAALIALAGDRALEFELAAEVLQELRQLNESTSELLGFVRDREKSELGQLNETMSELLHLLRARENVRPSDTRELHPGTQPAKAALPGE